MIEVLSETTARSDEGEKKEAYLSISSLNTYLLIEQDAPLIVAYQRDTETGEFTRKVYHGIDTTVPIPSISLELSMTEIYEGIEFS